MNKTLISGVVAALMAGNAMAQDAGTRSLDQIRAELNEVKAKNERLAAEVEYLKENTKAARKEAANEAVTIDNLKSTTSKFTWSGDFRYRNEQIDTKTSDTVDAHTRSRDRIRLRYGVTVKVNDTVTGRFQLATSGGNNDPRSTNQTLGEDWTRKSVGIDLAYVDWKPVDVLSIQLGKMPQPWTRTASYFWDGDITSEGVALKFTRGSFFAGAFYDWLNERHSGSATGLRSDSKLVGLQAGIKQPIGKTTLTVAAGYFDVTNVQNEQVQANGGTCTGYNSTFFGNSASGNTTYALAGCTALLSDFNQINLLAQLDFTAGKLPMTVFVDAMKNGKAETNPAVGDTLDMAYAAGVTIGKASNPMTWEAGLVYQKSEADAVFGQFHDSDFGDGKTDTSGFALKGAFAPAANWTLSATLFVNKLNNDTGSATTTDLTYKRLQLDLNFKF